MTKQAASSFDAGQPAIVITASVNGRIEQIQLVVGDYVNAGDSLVVINTRDEKALEYIAEAEFLEGSRDTNMHTYDKTRHMLYKRLKTEWKT